MKKITIFDSTLRDGEQAPGNTLSKKQKLAIASNLERLGVNTIEVGFPATSKEDYNIVSSIGKLTKNCKVCAFSRSKEGDIDLAGKALENANYGQIELLGSGSDINLRYKRKMSREEGLREAERVVRYARGKFPNIEVAFGIEDASRADVDYLVELSKTAVNSGAGVIVIADTAGCALPNKFGKIFSILRNKISPKVVLSAHCHNDLGLAVANSLAAIENGATEVQATVGGIGERCGNTQLEAFVMAIQTHPSLGCLTIKTPLLYRTARLIYDSIGRAPSYEAPIIGKNAFSTEAGMHQAGIFRNPLVYQCFDPSTVGRKQEIVVGHHSGKNGFEYKLRNMGLSPSEQEVLFVMKTAKKRRIFSDKDLLKIYEGGKK